MRANGNYGIGVIVMPKVESSCTFIQFIKTPSGTDFHGITIDKEAKDEAFASVAAQTARLFIQIGVIHFDLHYANALIFITSEGNISSLIIDFGRASNILDPSPDMYFNSQEKLEIVEDRQQSYDLFFPKSRRSVQTVQDKEIAINAALYYIAKVDNEKNRVLYSIDNPNHIQMSWFNDYKPRKIAPHAFDIFKRITTVNIDKEGIKSDTIKNYERDGSILSFKDTDADSFFADFPFCENPGFCAISGGKRHRRTKGNRKHKKTRKYRKSRRTN
jgi:hypothetical protein